MNGGELFTDGGVIDRNPSPVGGVWAYVIDGGHRADSGVILPGAIGCPAVTNNVAELWAICRGILALPEGWDGTLYTDSQMAAGWYFYGWQTRLLPQASIDLLREAQQYHGRYLTVRKSMLAGHPTKADLARGHKVRDGKPYLPVSEWNVMCDNLCNQRKRLHLMANGGEQ